MPRLVASNAVTRPNTMIIPPTIALYSILTRSTTILPAKEPTAIPRCRDELFKLIRISEFFGDSSIN